MKHPLYHLEVVAGQCRVEASLNEIPLAELVADGDQLEHVAPPVNPYLIGDENFVEVKVFPLPKLKDAHNPFQNVSIEVAVRAFSPGQPVVPGQGPLVAQKDANREIKERVQTALVHQEPVVIPQNVYLHFDNEGPSFEDELEEAPAFQDEGALRAYALVLRDLMKQRDASGLIAEMTPKIQAYAKAFDHPPPAFIDSLSEELASEFFQAKLQDFEEKDVVLKPICGQRMWILRRAPQKPLLQTQPDADGNTMQFEIIVAPRDGALKVVR